MSDPREEQREPDELELDPETVKDLDVEEKEGGDVRGGVFCEETDAFTSACPSRR